ncbi:MAG: hypothetical protein ACJAR4_000925 [Psychroserpens sp.]|jgi:hypothetical protein
MGLIKKKHLTIFIVFLISIVIHLFISFVAKSIFGLDILIPLIVSGVLCVFLYKFPKKI